MNILTHVVTRYARQIILLAIVLVVFGSWFGSGVFHVLTQSNSTIKGSDSAAVTDFTDKNFPTSSSDAILLYSAKHGTHVTDPAYKSEVQRLNALLITSSVQDYYTTGAASFISRDHTKTFVLVNLKNGTDMEKYNQLVAFRSVASSTILTINTGGLIVSNQESSIRVEHDLGTAEAISLPILAVLLLFIFRGVIAASLPLLLGILAIVGGLCVVRLLTSVTQIDQYSVNIVTILGLGLSVDYSLLIVARFREEFIDGVSVAIAVQHTMDKAGRTIIISGLTVMASLLSLTIFPVSLLQSVGFGGASALLIAMIAALTVLPAILTVLGKQVNKWQIHLPGAAQRAARPTIWRVIGEFVMRRPIIISAAVVAAVLVVASPALQIQFKPDDYTILPQSSQTYVVGKSLLADFDNSEPAIEVLYTSTQNLLSPNGLAAAYDYAHSIQKIAGVMHVTSLTTSGADLSKHAYQQLYETSHVPAALEALQAQTVHANTMMLTVQYKGDVGGSTAQSIVATLRATHPSGATIQVGGEPAEQYDLIAGIKRMLPYALAVIALTMFVLLAILLRSLLIPLVAMVINTFALLATFGVLVWIFQEGNLTNVTGLTTTGGMDITIPVLIFAIGFGLSMDYAVFLYSRIHEEYAKTKDTDRAILHGLELTGPLITQAATLFFVVVVAFATSGIALLQQIGIGLALAVLLDAFVVRVIFVPAVMKLFGKANWWLPSWLQKFI